jgi:hypothetical protein
MGDLGVERKRGGAERRNRERRRRERKGRKKEEKKRKGERREGREIGQKGERSGTKLWILIFEFKIAPTKKSKRRKSIKLK